MFSLPGAPALSQFRLDRLAEQLRSREPRVTGIASRFIHFVDVSRTPDSREMALLERLMTYGPRWPAGDWPPAQAETGRQLIVTPRIGTVSPWSSKATDIARVCGLDFVRRLERGCSYAIFAKTLLDEAALLRLSAALHDRMTETVWLHGVDPQALFQEGRAR